MLSFFSKYFPKKSKKIAFLDGDQPIGGLLSVHRKYLVGTETHLIRLLNGDQNAPKSLRNIGPINKIFLNGYATGKEVVDKFIGAYIQKSVSDGYTDITVVSSDYDFIDIFKMAVLINPEAAKLNFRIIVPSARGKLLEAPDQIANIQIIRM